MPPSISPPRAATPAPAEQLRGAGEFTALFTMSDLMSIGAYRALKDVGLEVPRDVSVIGFDGLPVDEFLIPRLTAVDQPGPDMARRGLELLLDAIENGAEPRHEAVPFTIVHRESTGPAKG